jgi:hypothetical protein
MSIASQSSALKAPSVTDRALRLRGDGRSCIAVLDGPGRPIFYFFFDSFGCKRR